MIRVIALTQFAFITLGIVTLKILIRANSVAAMSPYHQFLNQWSLALFVIPIFWTLFASICVAYGKTALPNFARIVGVLLAILSFLFLLSVTFIT